MFIICCFFRDERAKCNKTTTSKDADTELLQSKNTIAAVTVGTTFILTPTTEIYDNLSNSTNFETRLSANKTVRKNDTSAATITEDKNDNLVNNKIKEPTALNDRLPDDIMVPKLLAESVNSLEESSIQSSVESSQSQSEKPELLRNGNLSSRRPTTKSVTIDSETDTINYTDIKKVANSLAVDSDTPNNRISSTDGAAENYVEYECCSEDLCNYEVPQYFTTRMAQGKAII